VEENVARAITSKLHSKHKYKGSFRFNSEMDMFLLDNRRHILTLQSQT